MPFCIAADCLNRAVSERNTLKLGTDAEEVDSWGMDCYVRRNILDGTFLWQPDNICRVNLLHVLYMPEPSSTEPRAQHHFSFNPASCTALACSGAGKRCVWELVAARLPGSQGGRPG